MQTCCSHYLDYGLVKFVAMHKVNSYYCFCLVVMTQTSGDIIISHQILSRKISLKTVSEQHLKHCTGIKNL